MKKQRTHYDKAFKENAVKLSFERKNVSEFAHELGVEPLLLYPWRKEYQEKSSLSFPGNGVQSISEEAKKLTGKSGIYRTIFILVPSQNQTVNLNFIACTDADNNSYAVEKIGTQTWMVENMKTIKYRNGDSITNVIDKNKWHLLYISKNGAQCTYNNDAGNDTKYGRLYNFYVVTDSRNLAPAGWHVAKDKEWTTLVNYVTAHPGLSDSEAKALASTTYWASSTAASAIGNNLSKNSSSGIYFVKVMDGESRFIQKVMIER